MTWSAKSGLSARNPYPGWIGANQLRAVEVSRGDGKLLVELRWPPGVPLVLGHGRESADA